MIKVPQFSMRVMASVMEPKTIELKGNAVVLKNSGNTPAVIEGNYIVYPGESERIGLFEDNSMIYQNVRIDFIGINNFELLNILVPSGSLYPRLDIMFLQRDDCETSEYKPL
jgi:hypothetical protein